MDRGRLPNRRSIRLSDFDYTQNRAYFVTICAMHRLCLFGDLEEGVMTLSAIGSIVDSAWLDLPNHAPGITLDAWIVKPNHLHGIVVLPGMPASGSPAATQGTGPKPGSLGAVIGGFKGAVSRDVNAGDLTPVRPIWQRNYFERIIRNDRELDGTRRYI